MVIFRIKPPLIAPHITSYRMAHKNTAVSREFIRTFIFGITYLDGNNKFQFTDTFHFISHKIFTQFMKCAQPPVHIFNRF